MNRAKSSHKLNESKNLSVMVLLILLAALLRLRQLGVENLSYDETIIVTLLGGPVEELIASGIWGRPPILLLVSYPWVKLFGFSEVAIRLVPALAGILSMPIFYKTGRLYLGGRTALIGTALFAVSQFHLFHSQDFRYYSILTLFTLLSFYCYGRALRTGRFNWFLLTALTNIAVFYSHSQGAFVLLAQGIHFLTQWFTYPKLRQSWIAHELLTLVGMSQGIWIYFADFLYIQQTANPAAGSVFSPVQHLSTPTLRNGLYTLLLQYPFQGSTGPQIRTGLALGAFVATMGLVLHWRRSGWSQWRAALSQQANPFRSFRLTRRQWDVTLLLMFWLLCPLFLPIVVSQFFGPIYLARYTIPALPAAYLLLALSINWLTPIIPTRFLLIALLPAILIGLNDYYEGVQKDEWEALAHLVEANGEAGDKTLFVAINNEPANRVGHAFEYYYEGELEACGDQSLLYPTDDQAELLLQECAEAARIWLITRPINDRDAAAIAATFKWDERNDLRLVETWRFKKTAAYLLMLGEP